MFVDHLYSQLLLLLMRVTVLSTVELRILKCVPRMDDVDMIKMEKK